MREFQLLDEDVAPNPHEPFTECPKNFKTDGKAGEWMVNWVFLKIGVPPNHPVLVIYSNKPTIFGGSLFWETI